MMMIDILITLKFQTIKKYDALLVLKRTTGKENETATQFWASPKILISGPTSL